MIDIAPLRHVCLYLGMAVSSKQVQVSPDTQMLKVTVEIHLKLCDRLDRKHVSSMPLDIGSATFAIEILLLPDVRLV